MTESELPRISARAWFTLALLALTAFQGALTWPIRSSSFLLPAYVLVPTAVLLIIQLGRDLKRGSGGAPAARPFRMAGPALWLLLMPLLLAAAGLVFGGACYTFLFFKFRSGDGWRLSVAATLGVGGVLAVLAFLLHRPDLFAPVFW